MFIVVTYKKSKVYHTKYSIIMINDNIIVYYIVSKKVGSDNVVMMTSPAYDIFKKYNN